MKIILRLPLAVILFVTVLASAQASEHSSASSFFRQAAIDDVEFANRTLLENHPGAAPEMQDAHFQKMLQAAYVLAKDRAPEVNTAEGYLAVMSGFSNTLDDKHLSFKSALNVARLNWVGLIMTLRNGRWIVADEDPWKGRLPLKGATLVSCDGRSADDVARERLGGFRADWSIPAQRTIAAPWLLIDESNPFFKPLKQCEFSTSTGTRNIDLDWDSVWRDGIISRINAARGTGAAGYGVKRFGSGWWISIQEFTAKAPEVIEAARAVHAELRSAPFVVFDVRGNGGGSSDLGDQLAAVLYGDSAVPPPDNCRSPWRVSPENQAHLESYPRLLGDRLSPEARSDIDQDIAAMRKARADGAAFSGPITICSHKKPQQHVAPRVYLLTDSVCFSSCLLVVERFRELGAVQVGSATNGNTNYEENRRVSLPSGLGTIGVQAKVELSHPSRVGPFEPDIPYDGDLGDTAALQAWIAAKATGEWTRIVVNHNRN